MKSEMPAISLQDILVIEDDERVPNIVCSKTGIPLWTAIRNSFLRTIISEYFYSSPIDQPVSHGSRRAAVALLRYGLHNAIFERSRQTPICVMATGIGLHQTDGRWHNRLSDHFALAQPDSTWLVEDHHKWRWPFPRHFPHVRFHTPDQARASIAGRFLVRSEDRRQAETLLAIVCERAKKALNWEMDPVARSALVERAAQKAAAMPTAFGIYQRLFERLGTRLLLKEGGCYGPAAPAIAAAKSLGITVAEYQHGAVSENHDAYNFSRAVSESAAYRACLPDIFLAFGEWWCRRFNAPVDRRAIGYPHRENRLSHSHLSSGNKNQVLVLGDGIDTEKTLAFAQSLSALLRDGPEKVVFRPHPMERSAVLSRPAATISIDQESDLYSSLQRSHVVVGEHSTAIFESVGLADRIFVWDTPKSRLNLPHHPFARVHDPNELWYALRGGVEGKLADEEIRSIWATNWKVNYDSFVSEILSLTTKSS